MFEKVFGIIKDNLKNPKLYVWALVLLLVVLLVFPYIDANFFYYNRVVKRIDIITKISEIDTAKIRNDEILMEEYNSILLEIVKQSDGSLGSVFKQETNKTVDLIKFITGGALFWILAIACSFIKGFKNWGIRIFGITLISAIGVLFGLISKAIPTILTPMVNYIGFPFLLIIILCLIVTSSSKNKKGEKNND